MIATKGDRRTLVFHEHTLHFGIVRRKGHAILEVFSIVKLAEVVVQCVHVVPVVRQRFDTARIGHAPCDADTIGKRNLHDPCTGTVAVRISDTKRHLADSRI